MPVRERFPSALTDWLWDILASIFPPQNSVVSIDSYTQVADIKI